MTLSYALTPEDYLQNQLFTASKNTRIKKKRRSTWLMFTGLFLLFGLIELWRVDNKFQGYIFLIFAAITFIVYPPYQRYHYKHHYRKFIEDTYKNVFGKYSTIKFTDCQIEINDDTGETKINLSEIEEINEISTLILLKMRSAGTLIIAKSHLKNREEVISYLQELGQRFNINYHIELNWKWK